MAMRPEISQKIAALPAAPGVYLMKDKQGRIFYIGKAKSLRDRVRSYFSGSDARAFVALLEHLLEDIEVVLTDSEKEALLVENELVKAHQPRFNVELKDDKQYLCLRLDTRQTYPRIDIVRRFGKDGARYFGPYHSAASIRESLRIINRHFQLRTCSDQVMRNRTRPCLQYQIHRCPAPCVFDLSDGTYQKNVDNVVVFLQGRHDELLCELEARMRKEAAAQNYEAAAQLRDQIQAVKRSLERQKVVTSDFSNRDIVGFYREGPAVEIHVLRARHGRLSDAQRFSFEDMELPTTDVLANFASRYYGTTLHDDSPAVADLPDEILFPAPMEWADELSAALSERLGRKIRVVVPKRGDKHRLVALAGANARQAFADKQRERGAAKTAIERLQRALHLQSPPHNIECFDISHLQGSHIVASVVRFQDGVPNKDFYRRYRIRSTPTQDDFQSMYEVTSRRARRGLAEGDLPDLIVADGGKGQLAAVRAALDDHGVDSVDIIGLAKSRIQREQEAAAPNVKRSEERVFLHGRKDAIVLPPNSAELFLLTRARDEAHRFAITYQRQQQRKGSRASILDQLSGVGPKRRQALLKAFGSAKQIMEAKESDIAAVVGEKTGATIAAQLQRLREDRV